MSNKTVKAHVLNATAKRKIEEMAMKVKNNTEIILLNTIKAPFYELRFSALKRELQAFLLQNGKYVNTWKNRLTEHHGGL